MRSSVRLRVALRAISTLATTLLAAPVVALLAAPATAATEYLIVTSDALAGAFAPLAAHKALQGYEAEVVSIETIQAASVPGRDLPEQIRTYLRQAHQLGSLQYVLLGGDVEVVPARLARSLFTGAGGFTDIPTDLYYAALDGDWDADGDGIFGEADGDVADLDPEVAVGRAPVTTPTQAAQFVAKVQAYESPANSAHLGSALFAAEVLFPADWEPGQTVVLDGGLFADELATIVEAGSSPLSGERRFENDADFPGALPLTRQQALQSMDSRSHGLVVLETRGNVELFSAGDGAIGSADVLSLVNGPNYFVLISTCPQGGAFEQDCILEHFIRNPDGGAVAAIGVSAVSFPVPTHEFVRALHEQAVASPVPSLGHALNTVRASMAAASQGEGGARWTQLAINLLGDPELAIGPEAVRTEAAPAVRSALVLRGVVPNPFNPSTSVRFDLVGAEGSRMPVTVSIHDAAGRRVRTLWAGPLGMGPHTLLWDGRDARGRVLGSGAYIANIETATERRTAKLVLIK